MFHSILLEENTVAAIKSQLFICIDMITLRCSQRDEEYNSTRISL